EEHIKNLEEKHARDLQEQQESFDQKMIVEDQRYKKLEKDLEREKQEWETQHAALLAEHSQVIDQMKQDAEKIQRANRDTMDRIIKEKEVAFKHHQETLAQLERDADREIEELKEMYEQKLAQEKDDKVRLRGQAGIHQKHHHDLNTDMMKKEEEVRKKAEESRKAEEKILGLMKDKDSNEKEIKERDKTIHDKEQRIFDLKK
ncbi:CFAP57, partial [Symbiodinium pilosum]